MNLSILYRGPLSSCNYGCDYCPFAKHTETRQEHERDNNALEHFVAWVEAHKQRQIGVLFTPWGEALVRKRYQDALTRLTNMPHVVKIAIQTNLSCRLDWVEQCDKQKLALWATFHPTQISRARFLAKCLEADRRGIRLSVGVVGMKEHADEIAALRTELPQHIYLWINAYKRHSDYYTPADIQRFTRVDPLFPINNQYHPSQGKACNGGHTVISVDGDGTARRCHFIKTPIGNIYDTNFEQMLAPDPQPCTNTTCGCHIGYIHMPDLKMVQVFGDGLLERVPVRTIW